MKELSFVLFLNICLVKLATAFLSPNELKLFDVFVKPYGISFKDDLILNISQKLVECATFNETFKDCDSIFVKLASSITKNDLSELDSLSKSCPWGNYSCFRNTMISADHHWLVKVQEAMKKLCKAQCWETLEQQIDVCIHAGKSEIMENDKTYAQFVTEVLKSLCSQDDGLSCADKFISKLQKNSSKSMVCDLTKTENICTCQDLKDFIDDLKCCVGSVSKIMECYSIQPQKDSYGVFVKESYSTCKPPACTQDEKIPCPSAQNPSPSFPTSSVSSLTGKKVAGISLASLICLGVAIIVGNFLYHRWKKKAKIRYEDYGYSRLKMLEDELYFDVEIDDDDDESKGLVQL